MPPSRSSCFAMTVFTLSVLAGCLPVCPPPQVDREEFDLPGFGKMVVFTLPDATVTCPLPYFPRATPKSFLNNNRQLVLNAPTAGGCTVCDHVLLAQDGDLDTTVQSSGLAEGVNDSGVIALTINDRAAAWESGSVTILPIEGYGNRSRAVAVNDAGVVLGVNACSGEGCPPRSVLRWDPSDGEWTVTALFELTHFAEEVSAMNNRGEVVGTGVTVLSSYYDYSRHPFVWADGTMSLLPTPGGEGRASDINDAGWVVGYLHLPPATGTTYPTNRAVLWREGEAVDLGTLGGSNSSAAAINNLGQVVGAAWTAAEVAHAFLWEGGTMRDLNDLVPADIGITLSDAIEISDLGEILAVTSDDRLVLLRAND